MVHILIARSQSTGPNGPAILPTIKRFYFIREHRLHGTVTGMESVRIVNSQEDGLDRLLVSFKDAKVRVVVFGIARLHI